MILNQAELLETDVARLAGERDSSVEIERLDAIRREVARITEILERLGEMVETDPYETINYVGPARMIDLRSERRDGAGRWRRAARGLRILVVDDDLGICGTMKEILEASGCKVDVAHDGVEALARIESGEFDLMLTDVVMPKMDGHELYLAVQERFPDLPVLMMTAFHYDKDHIIKRSRIEGARGRDLQDREARHEAGEDAAGDLSSCGSRVVLVESDLRHPGVPEERGGVPGGAESAGDEGADDDRDPVERCEIRHAGTSRVRV